MFSHELLQSELSCPRGVELRNQIENVEKGRGDRGQLLDGVFECRDVGLNWASRSRTERELSSWKRDS